MAPTAATDVVLRSASTADLPAVLALLEASALPTAGVEEHVADFVVAEAGGALTGVAGLERYGDAALLRSVAVAESARGLGVGARLTTRVLESAVAAGARAIYLLTTTAEGYFPRLGFRRIERDVVPAAVRESVEFTTACPSTAAVMVFEPRPQLTGPLLAGLQAIAEEKRLRILDLLRTGEHCVCDLTDAMDAGQSLLSHHLKVLREAGLVADRRAGRWSYYRLVPEALAELETFIGALRADAEAAGTSQCC